MKKQILTILTVLSLSLILGAGQVQAESEAESVMTLGAGVPGTTMMAYGTGGN